MIYKIAAIYTNDIEDRNDLVQEIIYQLWKSFDTFNQKPSLSTWMYRVAMNVSIYHLETAKQKYYHCSFMIGTLKVSDTTGDAMKYRSL